MKIKVFDESHEKNVDVVDIKFAVSTSMYADEQIYCFSALVLYK